MNWWDILKIDSDSDIKIIKKAYAKLLKIYNPEDDAEGYQRLREAYDEAIKSAKKNKENISNKELDKNILKIINYKQDIVENDVDLGESTISQDNAENYEQIKENNVNIEKQIEEFSNKLNLMYMDKSLLLDIDEWDKLLNMEAVWNINSFYIVEDKVIRILMETKNLPVMIWVKLDNYFKWSKNEIDLYKTYDRNYAEEFVRILRSCNKVKCYSAAKFKYEHLKLVDAKFIDEYLNLRENGYEALNNKKLYKAKDYLFSAYKIFKDDPILLKSIAEFYFEINDVSNSLNFYKTSFEIDNSNLDVALSIGNILSMKQSYEEAIPYLEFYLLKDINAKALYNIGICYYYTGNLSLAKENFIKFLEIYPRNRSAKKYLNNAEEKLRGSQVKIIKTKDYKAPVKKTIKKEMEAKKIKAIFLILFTMLIIGSIAIHFMQSKLEDKKFIAVNEVNEFTNMDYNTNLKVKLNDIKGTAIIFSSEKSIKDNDYYEYEVKGAKCSFANSIFNKIAKDSEACYRKQYCWTMGQYIDMSQKEIHKAERSNELIFKKDGKEIKQILTAKDFKNSEYTGSYLITLNNIRPLDCYLFEEESAVYHFYDKKEAIKKDLFNKKYVQAFVGTIDDLNVMFIDSNFSINSIQNNKYTVKGKKYLFGGEELTKIKTEDGEEIYIFKNYIDNSEFE